MLKPQTADQAELAVASQVAMAYAALICSFAEKLAAISSSACFLSNWSDSRSSDPTKLLLMKLPG